MFLCLFLQFKQLPFSRLPPRLHKLKAEVKYNLASKQLDKKNGNEWTHVDDNQLDDYLLQSLYRFFNYFNL